jgi:hypothetical protein
MANGKWQTANGKRQMANGKRVNRVFGCVVGFVFCFIDFKGLLLPFHVWRFTDFKDFTFAFSRLAFHRFSRFTAYAQY